MAHYAKVVDGIVDQVIVADSKEWCENNLGGTWIQTSYNTRGNVHYGQDGNPDGGVALHKNYAGIGYSWDGTGGGGAINTGGTAGSGGGGTGCSRTTDGTAATVNTGGGGGGAADSGSFQTGKSGGSGIVIIRYAKE